MNSIYVLGKPNCLRISCRSRACNDCINHPRHQCRLLSAGQSACGISLLWAFGRSEYGVCVIGGSSPCSTSDGLLVITLKRRLSVVAYNCSTSWSMPATLLLHCMVGGLAGGGGSGGGGGGMLAVVVLKVVQGYKAAIYSKIRERIGTVIRKQMEAGKMKWFH